MPQFTSTGITNLIRHESGTYYLKTKIDGEKIRRSLGTKSKDLARYVLPIRINELKAELRQAKELRSGDRVTVHDYLTQWEEKRAGRSEIAEDTAQFYQTIATICRKRIDADALPEVITLDLWRELAEPYSIRTGNAIMDAMRDIAEAMKHDRKLLVNPFASMKHVKDPGKQLDPLSLSELEAVVESVREQKRATSDEAADFIQLLAFSGIRVGQARALEQIGYR